MNTARKRSSRSRKRRSRPQAPAPLGIPLGGWLLITMGVLIVISQYRGR